jgi:3-hydroxyisobutyrate dehydrogenase
MSTANLGFIGIGRMGEPMVLRLIARGHRVTVFNRSQEKLEKVCDAGARKAGSPRAVAAAAEIVFLCLTDAGAVEAVVFGPEGVAAGAGPGTLLVDCSSIAPSATREMSARWRDACEGRWVDAPVSGGVPGAEQGTLIFLCGGDAADIERIRPLLGDLGRQATHMGPVGSGQMTKLCNQAIVSCNLAVIAEAIHLAAAAGVDSSRLAEALRGGFADSTPLQIYGPRMAGTASGPPMGALATMLKDMTNVLEQARALGAPMPMTSAAAELYRLVAGRGYLEADLENLVRLFDP